MSIGYRTETMMRARNNDGLSLDDMRASLPAIFAEQPHESRSERYVYVSTADVIRALGDEGFRPFEARMSRSRDEERQGFAKHMIRFRSLSTVQGFRQVGDVSFEVVLRNAHDGTAAYDFMAGLFRLVCLNGMVVGDAEIASVHVRHSGNRQAILDKIVDGANAVLQTAPLALEAPRKWSSVELNQDEQMAFAESARTIRFGDADGKVETPITAQQLLHPRRPADTGNDLWRTFQRVQENTVRGGLSATGRDTDGRLRRTTTREVRSVDGDVRLNKALWTLAARMSELKGAQ